MFFIYGETVSIRKGGKWFNNETISLVWGSKEGWVMASFQFYQANHGVVVLPLDEFVPINIEQVDMERTYLIVVACIKKLYHLSKKHARWWYRVIDNRILHRITQTTKEKVLIKKPAKLVLR